MNAAPKNIGPRPPKSVIGFYLGSRQLLTALYGRWLDERGHENIDDYLAPFESIAEKHAVCLVRMTARPFGIEYSHGGKRWRTTVSQSGGYQLRRIA